MSILAQTSLLDRFKNDKSEKAPIRVLYSFPHKIGAGRICHTAWHQVAGLAAAGAEVTVFCASVGKSLPDHVQVKPTLAGRRFRLPNKILGGMAYYALHDWIVARRLEASKERFDVIHTWPLGALRTLKVAKRLGIPTVLERCNAHTRFAYMVVRDECKRLGVDLPPNHEHAYQPRILHKEEYEYDEAFRILCPSQFVVKTFLDQGFSPAKLMRHIYGFEPERFYPLSKAPSKGGGLRMLFVGANGLRKGLHFALQAWLGSTASTSGTFLIAGKLPLGYAEKIKNMLSHPTVKILGHRHDVPDLMRTCDILVLPSLEEGSALVVGEAMASGCVPLISDRAAGFGEHLRTALIHPAASVAILQEHISLIDGDRVLLAQLRAAAIDSSRSLTWAAAGTQLLAVYREVLKFKHR